MRRGPYVVSQRRLDRGARFSRLQVRRHPPGVAGEARGGAHGLDSEFSRREHHTGSAAHSHVATSKLRRTQAYNGLDGEHNGRLEYIGQTGDHKIRPPHFRDNEIRQASILTVGQPVYTLAAARTNVDVHHDGDAGRQQRGGLAGGVAGRARQAPLPLKD